MSAHTLNSLHDAARLLRRKLENPGIAPRRVRLLAGLLARVEIALAHK